jgi:1-acyl-sn-glycerol-3-phosphate acyltransferase
MKQWKYENDQWTKLPTHLRHLPLITRHFDYASYIIRFIWFLFLRYVFLKFYVRMKVVGGFDHLYKNHPKLLIMSNHSSHLDAVSIAAAIPFRYWIDLYIAAAKDYFFPNFWMSFFSKHCIGAIPIETVPIAKAKPCAPA